MVSSCRWLSKDFIIIRTLLIVANINIFIITGAHILLLCIYLLTVLIVYQCLQRNTNEDLENFIVHTIPKAYN